MNYFYDVGSFDIISFWFNILGLALAAMVKDIKKTGQNIV